MQSNRVVDGIGDCEMDGPEGPAAEDHIPFPQQGQLPLFNVSGPGAPGS